MAQDDQLDVVQGSAGCVGSLLALYRVAPRPETLAAAIQCGDRLLTRAQKMPQGLGWTTPIPSVKPLTGFAHGAAGMAWALAKLAAATGEERFRAAARSALAYERSQFCAEKENWPDLRKQAAPAPAASHNMVAWCQGAPGVGLGRVLSLAALDDPEMLAEIEAAVRTTLARGFTTGGAMNNHSLCHGDFGNLELLLQAGATLGRPDWRAEAQRLAADILEGARGGGWLCGVPGQYETPGLMTGLAGIGYQLLRLAEPARVPSVLGLAAPQ
jgi:lantibiotic modifying enzyme